MRPTESAQIARPTTKLSRNTLLCWASSGVTLTVVGLLVTAGLIFLGHHPPEVFHASSRRDVPVLLYHGVTRDPVSEYDIPLEVFSAQMAKLNAAGYHTLGLREYAEYLQGRGVLPPRSVFISFHDQSQGWYQLAVPLLRKLDFKASFFLIVNATPAHRRERRTSWDELREMTKMLDVQGSPLFEIAAHTFDHERLSRRSGEDEDVYLRRLSHEFAGNAEVIEIELGIRPIAFALPWGAGFEDEFERHSIRSIAERSGYQIVQTSNYFDTDSFWIGGMSIHGTTSSMLEFEFALRYADHESCFRDFWLWLAAVSERVLWRVLS